MPLTVLVLSVVLTTSTASWLLQDSVPHALERSGMLRANYKGAHVAPALGIVIALSAIAGYSMLAALTCADERTLAVVLGMVVSAFIGLLDDVAGRDSGKGFHGHFGRPFSARGVSTGVLKAVFVSLAAVIASRSVFGPPWQVLLRAAGIALTANLFNLLDLRPGRCIKVYLAVSALAAVSLEFDVLKYAPVVVGAVMVLRADLQARAMLGDCGSNLLGFVAGCQVTLTAPIWFAAVWLGAVLILNVASERYSFTSVIESNRVLRWLDMLGRVDD